MDAAVELTRAEISSSSSSDELEEGVGGLVAYEDGAALEGHVDAGAADLAAGAQRRDDHLVALPPAGGRALSGQRAARRGDGRHCFPAEIDS